MALKGAAGKRRPSIVCGRFKGTLLAGDIVARPSRDTTASIHKLEVRKEDEMSTTKKRNRNNKTTGRKADRRTFLSGCDPALFTPPLAHLRISANLAAVHWVF